MALHFENQVLLGDCLEVLRELPDNTFDSAVFDPPYGLGKEPTVAQIVAYLQGADLKTGDFMGKDWDIPSVLVWRELFRVLKPGGHVLSFGGTRTWDLISLGARAAGFENRDTIGDVHPALMWVQGQGMPKSTNISKQIDKKKGAKRKVVGHKKLNERDTKVYVPTAGVGGYNGTHSNPQSATEITEPATDEAKQWEGWGTGLKPCFEPVLVFRKPLDFKGIVLSMGSYVWSLRAKLVEACSPSNQVGFVGETSGSVPPNVAPGSATSAVSSEAMATSPFDTATTMSWNIASSWLNTLEGLLKHESTFTTETVSSLTTDLKILNSSLLKITPESMPQALTQNAGSSCHVEFVARMFDAVSMKLSAILASSVDENATEQEPRARRERVGRVSPTWEPILVFRKPFKGTLAENVLKHGTGALNIDATRVKHSSPEDFEQHKSGVEAIKARGGSMDNSWKNSSDLSGANEVTSAGRWPPNMILTHSPECRNVGTKKVDAINQPGSVGGRRHSTDHVYAQDAYSKNYERTERQSYANEDGTETVEAWDCAPGCPVAELDAQSGNRPSTLTGRADPNEQHENPGDNHGASTFGGGNSKVYADEGGASRFYPQFEGQTPVEVPFLYTGKASKKETNLDGEIHNDHPCLHPEAEVLTERGYRAVGTVAPGDKVYSADGRFHTVEAVTRHPYTSPDLFEISVGPHRKSLPTDNHPFLIWRPEKKGNSIVGSAVMWLRADQIRRGDYTMTPVLASAGSIPTGLPDDPEFWFLLGLYAAEGHIQRRDGRNDAYPRFSLHRDEQELIDRIRDYFGHEHMSVYPNGENGVQVMAFDSEKGALFESLAGNGAGSKVLAPVIWELPSDLRAQVFYGWLSGDGGRVRDELQGKTVSPDLAAQLQLLGEAVGFRSRVNPSSAPEGAGIGARKFKSTSTCFQLNFSEGRGNQPNRVTYEGVEYTLRFVTQVRPVPYVGDVVNLSVEGSPTFQTTIGMSHNTKKPLKLMQWLVKLVTPKGGITIDPYCGSGSTLHAAIEERMKYTGIERDPHFHEIASKRMDIVSGKIQDVQGQKDLYDFMMSDEFD